MANLTLVSPLRGWCAPLDETPDAVFAQRLLGDGVAIDPTEGVLYAPCDGEVISVAAACHAVALRATNGAEILLHVGIDTVALGGEGFKVLVSAGERVRSGQPLLNFDLDVLAQRAKSLITPIVITNGERFAIANVRVGQSVEIGDPLLELQPTAGSVKTHNDQAAQQEVTERVTIAHDHGIHARPAALIANFAKTSPAEIAVVVRDRKANGKSAVALMSLGAQKGDEVTLIASGPDATQAVAELKKLVLSLDDKTASAPAAKAPAAAASALAHTPGRLRGVIASRGLAVGRAVPLKGAEVQVAEAGKGIAHESAEFERARAEVRTRLEQIAGSAHGTAREVIAAHLEFLDDWELVAAARRSIARGKSAGFAWRRAVRESADTLRALGDPRMSERVDDLLDLESQVLLTLNGEAPIVVRNLPERAILIAEDLKPSQLVSLDATRLAGICLAAGGPTSHVAILAAAMGIPALVALGPSVLDIAEGAWLVLDAEQGNLATAPDQTALAAAEQTLAARQQRKQAERAAAHADCRTADGVRIEVFANLGSLAEAQVAMAHGAEGCGLLRTEFLFLDRGSAPDEAEQLAAYQKVSEILAGKPLVIRTLDAGGDKPIPYLPMPAEENPALGLRGIRTSLWRPDLLETQLRALLRTGGDCRILLPMITDVAEVRTVRRVLEEQRAKLGAASPQLGVMVETPAAALLADQLAAEVDFLSIGTNDLAQYTLAMDRGHAELAARIDGVHPAVLRLIGAVCEAAARHHRPVAVCGGLASDPDAVPLLLGLGVTELSAVPAAIPRIKALVGALSLADCRSLARAALALPSSESVRALLQRPRTEEVPS